MPNNQQATYRALTDIEIRKMGVHWGCDCDGCGMGPIVGYRWKCVICNGKAHRKLELDANLTNDSIAQTSTFARSAPPADR